jgi:phosphoglycolate phosphatase
MARRAIVFDFDGTIADSEQMIIEVYEKFAKKAGWPKLTHKAYVKLRSGSAREAMRWADIKFWQLPGLLKSGRQEYKRHKDEIKLFPYMSEVISDLADNGESVYILSSNSKETVRSILDINGLGGRVKILKGSPLFRKHKTLKRLLGKNNYEPSQSWMIGDEMRDIEAAKKAGMKSVGVVWGLQSIEALGKASPTAIARKPRDITKLLKGP